MAKTIYVCTGGCGGKATEEEYEGGKTTCGDPSCPKHGQPFTKMMKCEECGVEYKPDEAHSHVA